MHSVYYKLALRPSEALLDGKAETQTPCLAVVLCYYNSLLNWFPSARGDIQNCLAGLSVLAGMRTLSRVRRTINADPSHVCVSFFACFSRHISQTQSFQEKRHIYSHVLVSRKLLISLDDRLIACIYSSTRSTLAKVGFLACFHAISLERSRFRKNAQFKSKILQP